jgi:hypothetical protein
VIKGILLLPNNNCLQQVEDYVSLHWIATIEEDVSLHWIATIEEDEH